MMLERIRVTARAFGIDLKRYSPFRRAIDMLATGSRRPFFVQIGANNGTDFDNFFEAVTAHRLPGLLIEPIADYHQALLHAYARFPEVRAIRAAIHPDAASLPMYRVASEQAQFLWHHGLASFDRDHLRRHDVPDDAIVEEPVPCLSMTGLMELIPPGQSVDILAIDTEGFDAQILRMIDFTAMHPRALRFEDKHMSDGDRAHFTRLLESHGYRLIYLAGDAIAIDRSLRYDPLSYLRRLWPRRRQWRS